MIKKDRRRYAIARLRELKDAAIVLDLETMDVDNDLALYDSVFHCFARGDLDHQFESIVFDGLSEDERVKLIDLVKDYRGLCFYKGEAEYWLDSLEQMPISDSELIAYSIFDNYDYLLELGQKGGKRVLDQISEFEDSGYVNSSVVEYLRQSNADDEVLQTVLLDMAREDSLYNVFTSDQKALLLGNPLGTLYTYTEDGVEIKSPLKLACELYVETMGEGFDLSGLAPEDIFKILREFLLTADLDNVVVAMADEYVSSPDRYDAPEVVDAIKVDSAFDYLREYAKEYAPSYGDGEDIKTRK